MGLRDSFVSRLPAHAAACAELEDLEQQLLALHARGVAAWPEVDLSVETFVVHLAERLPQVKSLEQVHPEDLYLACACAAGDPAALQTLERSHLPGVARAVKGLDTSGVLGEEVQQLLRERLLMPRPDGPPRIAGYAGQGPLKSWLKAAAIRHALNLKRPGNREEPVENERLAALPIAARNPELELIRKRHRQHFAEAFEAALASLEPRERTLLKLHTLDGLPFDQIGPLYKKDKSTISRWIDAAQVKLLKVTREHLTGAIGLDSRELESVLRVAQSELSLSLTRLLDP